MTLASVLSPRRVASNIPAFDALLPVNTTFAFQFQSTPRFLFLRSIDRTSY